jgi:hypothetical protein
MPDDAKQFAGAPARRAPPRLWIGKLCVAACALMMGASESDAASLDLSHFTVTFEDDFRMPDVCAQGPFSDHAPGMRWIAHTPWHGDFGDAVFDNPSEDGPFAFTPNGLRISATKAPDGKWHSGLIASVDRDGDGQQGFSQKYGYFEMRAKFPEGPGVWPAFWLSGVDKSVSGSEIDIVEYYGKFPDVFHATEHVWNKDHPWALEHAVSIDPHLLTSRFNTYGLLIDEKKTVFYLNREPVWETDTPPEYRQPLYILANLALGPGWPTAGLRSPAVMEIEYIKVFKDTRGQDASGQDR